MCENALVFVPIALSCYSPTCILSYKCTVHIWVVSVFKLLEVSVCILWFSWMPRCQASVIQRKHLAQFEVNCHKTVLEISKKGPGKSLKSPWIFCVEKCTNPENYSIFNFILRELDRQIYDKQIYFLKICGWKLSLTVTTLRDSWSSCASHAKPVDR